MKKFYTMLLASVFLPAIASAAEKLDTYFSVEGGRAFYDEFNKDDYDRRKPQDAYVFGLGIGKYITEDFSVEGNIHHFGDIKVDQRKDDYLLTQKLKATNLGLNLKYSANNLHYKIKPFVGIGAGLALVDSGVLVESNPSVPVVTRVDGKSKYNFSYNAEVGIIAPLSKDFSVKVGYHFFDLGRNGSSKESISDVGIVAANPNGQASTRIRVHVGMLGLQYNF